MQRITAALLKAQMQSQWTEKAKFRPPSILNPLNFHTEL